MFMLQVTPELSISSSELTINYIHGSGPGGQNVNKVATAVQLRFNVRGSTSLSPEIKDRLGKLAGKKMTKEGELVIEAKRFRLQERNRVDAEHRLITLVKNALVNPKCRRPTLPTQASQERRIGRKKLRGKIKSLRKFNDE
jgi:ribosome-associated protein